MQSLSALISSHISSSQSLSLFVAILERFYCRYVTLRCDLELWPRDLALWPWTFVVYLLCHDQTVYQIWAKSSNRRRSYCDLSIWPYDLEHVSRVALCSGIVCTKSSYSFMKCDDFFTLICRDVNKDKLQNPRPRPRTWPSLPKPRPLHCNDSVFHH